MIKRFSNFERFIAVIILSVAVIFTIHMFQVDASTEGEELVIASKDYVDEQIGILMAEIESLKAKISGTDVNLPEEASVQQLFKVVELEKNQKLIGEEGTEIIVRSGNTTAITGSSGEKLVDVTDGYSDYFDTGAPIPINHLLVVSRSDGRGIESIDEKEVVYVLVKGGYSITDPSN